MHTGEKGTWGKGTWGKDGQRKGTWGKAVVGICVGLATLSVARAEEYTNYTEVKEFLDRQEIPLTLEEMESRGLRRSEASTQPWSDTYWPDMGGSIAAPYAAPGYHGLPWSYSHNLGFVNSGMEFAERDFDHLTEEQINRLSPAQKYDLLLGDRNFTFSHRVIDTTTQLGRWGQMAMWSGICHGWSPASIQYDRPEHSFTVRGQAGHTIRFYPSDMKALMDWLWAKSYAQNFVKVKGWQCRDGRRDLIGRLQDPKCFDVNPAQVFLSIVGQIGLNRRPLVMDRSYGKSVQNQPTFRYSYRYVRLNNGFVGDRLERAKLRKGSFVDPFYQYRSPLTQDLVGIEMVLSYTKETSPSHRETDSPANDRIYDITIRMSLELDAQGKIVGGEWHEDGWDARRPTLIGEMEYSHPDILWVVPADLKAWSTADADLGEETWDLNSPLPAHWRTAIHKATMLDDPRGTNPAIDEAILRPQPLAKIIDALLDRARPPRRTAAPASTPVRATLVTAPVSVPVIRSVPVVAPVRAAPVAPTAPPVRGIAPVLRPVGPLDGPVPVRSRSNRGAVGIAPGFLPFNESAARLASPYGPR